MQGFEGAGAVMTASAMKAAMGVGGGMCFAAGRMDAWHVRLLDETDKRSAMPHREIDQELVDAAEAGASAKVSALLAKGAAPMCDSSQALQLAAKNGHVECVKLLLPVSDPQADEWYALRAAAHAGHVECVRLLLPMSDAKARDSQALRYAAHYGHVECVRMLLPASDAKAGESLALRLAALNGHAECVRLLLPVSDAKANDSEALRWAARNGHAECVKLLLAHSLPLVDIGGVLREVMTAGHARVASRLIEEEPRLLDGMDLSKCLVVALENGQEDMAGLLSSIIDKRELVASRQMRRHAAAAYGTQGFEEA